MDIVMLLPQIVIHLALKEHLVDLTMQETDWVEMFSLLYDKRYSLYLAQFFLCLQVLLLP